MADEVGKISQKLTVIAKDLRAALVALEEAQGHIEGGALPWAHSTLSLALPRLEEAKFEWSAAMTSFERMGVKFPF